MTEKAEKAVDEKYAPMMEHLEELRKTVLHSIYALVIATVVVYLAFNDVVANIIMEPFISLGLPLNFMTVTEGFMVYMKIAFLGGVVLSSPVIIWKLLRFILPALYSHEKKIFFAMLISGVILFVGGICFGYFFILRLGLNALLFTFSGDLVPMISASSYVSFVLRFLIPFGLMFELPMVVYFLTKLGIINPPMLEKNRKYVLLVVLILAALLTPPDIVSQVGLAIPMMILYEVSIWISRKVYNRKLKKEAKELAKQQKREM